MAAKAQLSIPKPPADAKKRVRAVREQIASARVAISLPALLTVAEVAEALRVSKPTVVRLIRRGELQTYRPNGPGGVVHVIADSVADHVTRSTYGRPR